MIYDNPCRTCFFKGRFNKQLCKQRCHKKRLYLEQKEKTRIMDQHDCDTCKHFDKYGNEEPCNSCNNNFSKWEHVDEDEGDDK